MLKKMVANLFDNAIGHALVNARGFLRERSLLSALEKAATVETVAFLHERARAASYLPSRLELLSFAISRIASPGLHIELGVKKGHTINHIARKTKSVIHGFDSFVGFPSAWEGSIKVLHMNEGDGSLPDVESNVRLYKGWFHETLPLFVSQFREGISFMHVDCDIYESTKTAFDILGPQLAEGAIIVFDEYFNYWGWQNHEHKAFEEYLAVSGRTVKYLGFSEQQLTVQV